MDYSIKTLLHVT